MTEGKVIRGRADTLPGTVGPLLPVESPRFLPVVRGRADTLPGTVGPLLPVESPCFLPVVLLFHLEPLQRPTRHVAGLGVLPHDPLVPARHRLLPRFEPVIRQPPRRKAV